MAAYVKYYKGIEVMMEGGNAQTDSWRVILSNTAPVVPEAISALTVEKYTQKPTLVSANELQSHLEIDDEEAILMFI